MGRTVIDIDVMLGEDALELVLGGRTYVVEDIPFKRFAQAMQLTKSDPENNDPLIFEQLALLMGLTDEQKEHMKDTVGLRTATFAVRSIRDWVVETMKNVNEEAEEGEDVNP